MRTEGAGEIRLAKRKNEHEEGIINNSLAQDMDQQEDFEEWNIEILVKFRKEAFLSRLSHLRQSGGERSVATFLYLMSLQDIISCPFRVVDEINQGMDAYNEAKMHELLVNITTATSDEEDGIQRPKSQ